MLSIDEEWMVVVNGARLWSAVRGVGTPILFFNGGPGCDDYLAPVANLLDATCRVIRFEPRGCGRSDWDGQYDLDTLLADADALREAYGIDRWLLLGHSAGPNAALAYALRYPTYTIGIIGIAGGNIVDDREWSAIYHARLESIGEETGSKSFHADPEVNRQGNASWRAYCKQPTLLRELADLPIPCVFINGAADIRPNWPTQQLAELLPKAYYSEIPGAAHTIWLTHAQELQNELQKALAFIKDNDHTQAT